MLREMGEFIKAEKQEVNNMICIPCVTNKLVIKKSSKIMRLRIRGKALDSVMVKRL
jgi:hypothetical protein